MGKRCDPLTRGERAGEIALTDLREQLRPRDWPTGRAHDIHPSIEFVNVTLA